MIFQSHGILGQNARNLLYIKGDEFAASRKIADSKLGTKKFLVSHDIAVPETLSIIKKHSENTPQNIESLEAPFVVKPNNGYGGKGILIVDERLSDGNFLTNTGEVFTPKELREHFNYILDGFFSLSGGRDRVIIEKKIILTKEIELLGTFGLPDIRVIAYNMVPVMAMIRIPTKESEGKANIHGGACAAGIDIAAGKITYISYKGKTVKTIPGIGDIRGIVIPEWDKILSLVVAVQKATGIKFLGCDIVLDEAKGPLLLEINLRPGLEIQNVNLTPLRERLDKLEGVEVNSVEKGVRLGKDLFSGDIEEKIRDISGKQVVGPKEYLTLWYGEKTYTYLSHIKISSTESLISNEFATNILKIDTIKKKKIRLECEMLGKKRTIRFEVSDNIQENIVLGKSALRGFLIDPFKYKKGENPVLPESLEYQKANTTIQNTRRRLLKEIDAALFGIDKKLLILKYTTPTNIEQQKQIFIEKKGDYVPRFEYNEIPFDIGELEQALGKIEIPDIPHAQIFQRKKEEIYNKLQYFKAFNNDDGADMMRFSEKIYGSIKEDNFEKVKDRIGKRDRIISEEEFLDVSEIESYIKKFNNIYNIKVKLKQEEKSARFTMKGDTLIIRHDAIVGKREIRGIIAHEIEGHYLRKINGRKSDFRILSSGGAGYIETDEGLAVMNQNRFVTEKDAKYYSVFERYYFVGYAMKHSYKRLIAKLAEFYNDDYARVFAFMLRLKRGFSDPSKTGVFMKDVVYVNGYYNVEEYMNTPGVKLEDLYVGKLHISDIRELQGDNLLMPNKNELIIPFSA